MATKVKALHEYNDVKTIIVNQKTWDSYFKDTGVKLFNDEFDKLREKMNDQWIVSLRNKTIQQHITTSMYGGDVTQVHKEWIEKFSNLFPKSLVQCINSYKSNDRTDYKTLLGHSNVKWNDAGMRTKLKKIRKRYPLIANNINKPLKDKSDRWIEHVKLYIEMI